MVSGRDRLRVLIDDPKRALGLPNWIFVYIDDVVIFSNNYFQKHRIEPTNLSRKCKSIEVGKSRTVLASGTLNNQSISSNTQLTSLHRDRRLFRATRIRSPLTVACRRLPNQTNGAKL